MGLRCSKMVVPVAFSPSCSWKARNVWDGNVEPIIAQKNESLYMVVEPGPLASGVG